MYFNSKLTGRAQKLDNIKNHVLAYRTTQKSTGNGWNLLYNKKLQTPLSCPQ